MTLILDSSATLAWCFTDETTAEIVQVFQHVQASGAVVPAIWPPEVANGLRNAGRRGRFSAVDRAATLDILGRLPVAIDTEDHRTFWKNSMALADLYGLTSYDACFLELAMRRPMPLATLDVPLRRAAAAAGVPLMGL